MVFLSLLSDGVGRTGTFLCLHSQLERLKTEGVVDFFQAVKSARIQRAGLVPDAVCSLSEIFTLNNALLSVSPSRISMPTAMRCWLILSTVMTTMPISRMLFENETMRQ